jgi:DNA-directed RNA polymerase II subunit RPB2
VSSLASRATKVFVNGYWLGMHTDPDELMGVLREFRQKPDIPSEISLYRNIREREICIFTDAGRVCRPLLVVKDNKLLLRRQHVDALAQAKNEVWC